MTGTPCFEYARRCPAHYWNCIRPSCCVAIAWLELVIMAARFFLPKYLQFVVKVCTLLDVFILPSWYWTLICSSRSCYTSEAPGLILVHLFCSRICSLQRQLFHPVIVRPTTPNLRLALPKITKYCKKQDSMWQYPSLTLLSTYIPSLILWYYLNLYVRDFYGVTDVHHERGHILPQ